MSPTEFLSTDPVAIELLASSIPARLAYTALDGTPRVVPVGFHHVNGRIAVATAERAPKAAAIRAAPTVALTIDTTAHPPVILQIRGKASVSIVDGVDPDYLIASRKLVPSDQWSDFEQQVHSMYARMARIEITPTWAEVFDFQTRVPRAISDLAAD